MASMMEKRGILDGFCCGERVKIPAVQKRVLLPALWPVNVLQLALLELCSEAGIINLSHRQEMMRLEAVGHFGFVPGVF